MIVKRFVCALALSACAVWVGRAQEPTPKPAPPAQPGIPPPAQPARPTLMVEITVNRVRDGKRVSSTPYTLAVSPDGPRSTLRIGGEVPIPTTTFTPGKEPNANPFPSFSYRNVGTSIDVQANSVTDGGYRLSVTFEESSVYPPGEAEKSGMTTKGTAAPAFRSLRASNAFTIRDTQTVEFTAGSDLISGETARIAVKMTVVK